MKRLSDPNIFRWKFTAPLFLLSPVLLAWLLVLKMAPEQWPRLAVASLFFIGMAWHLYGSKVDEVFDCEDAILVRRGGKEARIPLADILSVELVNERQTYVKVTLARTGVFGRRIEFFDAAKAPLFKRATASEGVAALVARVEQSKK